MNDRSRLRFSIPFLLMGWAFSISAVRGDEPGSTQPAITTETSQQYQGIAEVYSLISREATPQLTNRPVEQLSEFWIGVTGNPIDDVLRLHLDLPEKQGMLITEVIDDSPAARAGLKANDVLVSADEKPIKESADLAALISEKKETRLALRLIRAGKPIIIEITPTRRPASQTGETCPSISKADDAQFVSRVYLDLTGAIADAEKVSKFVEDKEAGKREKLVNKLLRNSTVTNKSCTACHSADDASLALSRRLLGVYLNQSRDGNLWLEGLNQHPTAMVLSYPYAGVLLNEGTISERIDGPNGLPDDISITITRKGQNPTQITVRRGDQIWDATADNYQEKLPAEIRPYVSRWMVGAGQNPSATALSRWVNGSQTNAEVSELTARALSLQILDNQNKATTNTILDDARLKTIEKETESLNQQLSQIQQTLDKLRKCLHGSTDNPGEPAKK